jgi:hypothetical protein
VLSLGQRQAIDRAKEDLVTAAEDLLVEAEVRPSKDFGHSQFRNLVAVAAETESPTVILNFIRYQMGRDRKEPKGWSLERGGKRLGDRFIHALSKDEGAVSLALVKVPGIEEDPMARQLARIELIRYFLGFATRYMKYLELEHPKGNES